MRRQLNFLREYMFGWKSKKKAGKGQPVCCFNDILSVQRRYLRLCQGCVENHHIGDGSYPKILVIVVQSPDTQISTCEIREVAGSNSVCFRSDDSVLYPCNMSVAVIDKSSQKMLGIDKRGVWRGDAMVNP